MSISIKIFVTNILLLGIFGTIEYIRFANTPEWLIKFHQKDFVDVLFFLSLIGFPVTALWAVWS